MLKFFRKYNKVILSVGFAFLMVVFLLPAGVSNLVGDPRSRPVIKYDGGEITQGEMMQAQQELQFLSRIHPAFVPVLLSLDDRRAGEHWLLLSREAEAAGLVGGPGDGRNSLEQLAQTFTDFELNQRFRGDIAQIMSQRDAIMQEMLFLLEANRAGAINAGQPAEAVDRILARARGVVRLYTIYLNTLTLSQPELVVAAQDAINTVTVNLAPISAAALVDDQTPEPTEDQILEHFEEFKSVPPRQGEFGFGYLREPAVQLEWMVVSRREFENAVKLDPVDVNVYWQHNKDRFGADFATARPRVERELRDQQVERAMSIARQVIKGQILQASGPLPEKGGRKILPDDWASKRPNFEAIAARVAETISDRMGLTIAPPDVLQDFRWLTRSDVASLPTISASSITIGRSNVSFADFVYSIPELGGAGLFPVQPGVAYADPLTSTTGDSVYFRILEARPQSPPESVDEVREQIVNNLKRFTEYQSLLEMQSELVAKAAEVGLEDATLDFDVTMIFPNVQVSRDRVTRRTSASDADMAAFSDAVMTAAMKIDPSIPIAQAPADQRYLAAPQPSIMSLALVEIVRVAPMSRETFQSIANQILINRRTQLRSQYDWPFTLERMRQRHNVKSLVDDDDDESDAGADQDVPVESESAATE